MDIDLDFLEHNPGQNFFSDFLALAAQHTQLPALVYGDQRQTYGQLLASVERCAAVLAARGVRTGSRVQLLVTNCPEMVWLQLALLRLGARIAPCEIRMAPQNLAEIASDFRPQFLCYHDSVAGKARTILDAMGGTPSAIAVASGSPEAAAAELGHSLLHELLENAPGAALPPLPEPETRVLVCYRPDREDHWRGAVFSLAALCESAGQIRTLFALHRGDSVMCQLSLAHFVSLSSIVLPTFLSAGSLVLLDRSWDDARVIGLMEEHNPRLMLNTRKYFWYLTRSLQEAAAAGRPFRGSVRHALMLMDGVQPRFRDDWEAQVRGHLLAGFAPQCAAGFLALDLPWLQRREEAVGKLLPGVDVRIIDESGHPRPLGKWGEVQVRSPRLAEGYHGGDSANPEAAVDGWLPTRQMAMSDGDGFLHLADEVFDVIWVYGFKVSPVEVEEPMLELPGIRDVAAVNAPRFRQPDRIQVFVQLETRDGQPPRWTAESLQEKLDAMFPPYLRPAMVTFVDHIPYDDEERKLRKELKFKYRNTEPWRSN